MKERRHSYKPTADQFRKQVAGHVMTVEMDAGVMRTIKFMQPKTSDRWFRITTWPGTLCISGDMGCYVFSRLPDMFEFFRARIGDGHSINPQYWAEKLLAHDRGSGHEAFSEEFYHDALRNDFRQWQFDDWSQMRRAWQEVRDELWEPNNLHDAVDQALRYQCAETQNHFQDFWDHRLEDYTHGFIWCCRAIVWAIEQYDAARVQQAA